MSWFTSIFLVALVLGLLLQLWLLQRHKRHVVGHRDDLPPAFAGQVSIDQHQKAADYTVTKISLSRLDLMFGALLLLVWTLGGGIQFMATLWDGMQLSPLVSGIALVISVFMINAILDLPFSLWRTFKIEARFGFNNTTPQRYIADLLLQLVISLVLGVPLLSAILWLMQESGSLWWLSVWVVWVLFSLLVSWIFPTLIAPLFNRFTPLEDASLVQRLDDLLERCGFSSKGVFVMDGSRRSSHGNAYFTGFGRSKRIVFFDTLLETLEDEEVEAVLAHELGHFKRHHVRKGMLLMAAASFVGLALLGWLIQQPWFFHGLGVTQMGNAVALLLFLLVTPVFTIFLTPLFAMYQRRHEFEADDFAVEQSGAAAMISSLVKLYRENASTLTPDPLYSAFHDSHPPAPIRVAHLSQYL
jgi:STE24 endopeptidase